MRIKSRTRACAYTDDLPPGIPDLDEIWEREVLKIALNSPHAVIGNNVYFKSGMEVMVITRGIDTCLTPEIVSSPKILNRVYLMLGCFGNIPPASLHSC